MILNYSFAYFLFVYFKIFTIFRSHITKPMRYQSNVLLLSIASRIFVLLLGKLLSVHFQHFDPSSAISTVRSPLKYLERWDVVHFINISENGYTHEHSLPFFPLVPLMVRTLSFFDTLTTGVILSNISFILSSVILYRISILFFSEKFSFIACIFFIFNPASIIYSSPYTESVFTLIFLLALFYTITGQKFRAALCFSLCTFCRSNGILFIIFSKFLYAPIILLPICLFQLYSFIIIAKNNASFRPFIPYSMIQAKYWEQGFLKFLRLKNTPNLLIGLPVILLSIFFLYEYARSLFLKSIIDKKSIKIHNDSTEQENIGNIPVDTGKSGKYTGMDDVECTGMGDVECTGMDDMAYFYDMKINLINEKKSSGNSKRLFSYELLSYRGSWITKLALILLLQTLMLVFQIHWNIAMRFIGYNPFIYWSSAYFAQKHFQTNIFIITSTFFAVYGILYIVMFSCFYPPP